MEKLKSQNFFPGKQELAMVTFATPNFDAVLKVDVKTREVIWNKKGGFYDNLPTVIDDCEVFQSAGAKYGITYEGPDGIYRMVNATLK